MFAAMNRTPAERENADVLAICEKLELPERPAKLQMVEANLRSLKKDRSELSLDCQASWAKDRAEARDRPSTGSLRLQAKINEIDGAVKAARLVVDAERRNWRPRFRDALTLPVSAAHDLL